MAEKFNVLKEKCKNIFLFNWIKQPALAVIIALKVMYLLFYFIKLSKRIFKI